MGGFSIEVSWGWRGGNQPQLISGGNELGEMSWGHICQLISARGARGARVKPMRVVGWTQWECFELASELDLGRSVDGTTPTEGRGGNPGSQVPPELDLRNWTFELSRTALTGGNGALRGFCAPTTQASADKTSVASADKTFAVSAAKTSVVSADKRSAVCQDIP